MGGRGTYAAGNHVAYQYETIGYVEGVKVLQLIDKNKTQKLPEESQSSNAYIKLNKDGSFCQYREFNDKHELVLEIGYHPEEIVTYTKTKIPVLHIHEYHPDKSGKEWRDKARKLTKEEFSKYKKYFVGLNQEDLDKQKEWLK